MNADKEKLLNETYEKFIRVSMNKLPPEIFDDIAAEDITGFGTAIDEKILSISDSRDLIDRQMEQLTGMELNYEIIPGHRRISPEEDSVLIVDEIKINIKSPADTHKLFIRNSTIMEFIEGKWKAVHFHSSRPDDTKGETDTWYINEWKRKNEELQKLVNEKTTELVIKNRDLEIEASLERVRTIAMGMRRSENLLDICETLFGELQQLGFDELRNTMINIHNDEEKTFVNYDYSDTLGKTITPLYYNINPVIAKQIKQIRKGRDAFSETSFKGEELKEWKKFRKRKGEPDDPRLKNTKSLYYYFYSIGTGSIGISTFGSVTKEKLELLKRFRNVFEFAYRRYIDVMQAEEQAKEARLEASLERVRAQAMGINKSEQLGNISETVFTELKALGFADLRNAEIIINSDKKESVISYYYSDYGVTETIEIFYNTHPKVKKWAEEMRKADDAFTSVEFGEDEIAEWRKYREEIGYLPDPKLNNAKAVYYYSYSIGPGALSISSFKPINSDQLRTLERFKNVFGLAYRRYADVALAEAQAGEAKLEASLERVRTHSMVMKKPDDLVKVCESLFNELRTLGFVNLRNSQIVIFNDDNKSFLNYDYSDYAGANTTTILNNSHPLIHSFISRIKKSKEAFAEFSMELKDWKRFRRKNGELPDPKLINVPFVYYYFYSIGTGAVGISAFAAITKEELEILKRFRNVFEFAYGKYSDVTKADAQTREAQIELSLERVRARSMAMHRSDELVDASIVLFNELKSLGIESIRTGVGIFDEAKKAVEIWSSQLINEKRNKILGVVPFKAHPFFELNYKAWKRKEPYYFYEMAGKEVKKYYKVMSTVLSYPEKIKFNPKEIFYTFFFPEGSLNVVSNNNLTGDECSLMLRFAKVFGMIYRRFLDLQKAEAQAREAQIELALERVRARTMAMQRSDELEETSQILFKQFKELGEAPERITIGTINETKRQIELWVTVEGYQNRMVKVSIDEPNVIHKIYSAWKRQKKSILIDIKGKELRDYISYRKSFGNDHGIGEFLKDRMIVYVAFFSKGIISITTPELLPTESILLLERFAGVFDLTYTRFLDLQKAEAQAREALVEVALERVRSRTMAMHKSEELAETAAVLFQQLCGLGIDALRLYIGIIDEESNEIEFWTTDYGGCQVSSKYKANLFGSTTFRKMYNGWKEKKKSFIVDPKGKELTEHLYYLKEIMNYPIRNRKTLSRRLQTIAYFSKGLIGVLSLDELPKESINILERFAGVFDLTYRRFLDLQTSEAQTKEAQIEVALERVRSRTMAMHSSSELKDAAVLLFQQIRELGVDTGSCGYVIWENENKDATVWMSSAEGSIQDPFKLPHTKSKTYKEIYSAKEDGKDFFVKEVSGAELKKHFDYLSTVPGIGEKINQLRKARYKFPETIVYNTAFFKQGYLSFHTHEQIPDAQDIFRRFANVFEQTYTRFLDLQKAEAQAAEARIEAALERVRSRTMGMQKSEELKDVIQVVLEQFVHLNINAEHAGFVMDYKARDDYNIWVADPLGVPSEITIPYFDSLYYNRFNEAKVKGEDFFAVNLTFKEKNIFYKKLFKFIPGLPEESKKFYFSCPGLAASTVLLENVCLYIENFSGTPYSDEENNTLMRFGKVFQQTYTRFLDLQKAEAQAREAQIEAALEKVRSRSLAMHKADELGEVITVVVDKLKELDFTVSDGVALITYSEGSKDLLEWMANPGFPSALKFHVPYFEHPILANLWKAKNEGKEFIMKRYTPEENKSFLNHIFEHSDFKHTPKPIKDYCLAADTYATSIAFQTNTSIFINDYSGKSLSEQEIDILKRFSNVFEQAYVRFLDLQKAEAQAREAQIEAALEKVRGKAMAMHNSSDLTDAAGQVFTELNNLGFKPIRCGFVLLSKDSRRAKLYPAASFDYKNIISFTGEFEFTGHPVYEKQYESWQKKENYYPVLEGEILKSYYKILAKALSVPYKNFLTKSKKQFGTFLPFKEGFLFTWSDEPYSGTEINILDRFKGILDLTIRRYLDLQKAEEQTREAQIEAGLERVRSRAMAMHKTDELLEAAELVYKELSALGITSMNVSYSFPDKDEKYASYYSVNPVDGKTVPLAFIFPHTETKVMRSIMSSWKKQESFNLIDLDENATLKHQTWAGEHIQTQITKNNINIPFSLEAFLAISPKTAVIYTFNFSKGYLFVIGEELLTKMQEDLLMRFTKVFEQAYIRFLDLQKAETQAREAKIEAALERARTQSMLMQHSNELNVTSHVFHEQLQLLGIDSEFSFVWLPDEKKNEHLFWTAWSENKDDSVFIQSKSVIYPLDKEERYTAECFRAWESNEPVHEYFVPPEEINNYFAVWSEILSGAEHLKPEFFKKGIYYCEAFIKYGCFGVELRRPLTDEEKKILLRFAIEFERAYTRFLDLQKAEAQTREAQIEAALERVRSKAMAMQKSNDLSDAVGIVFEEMDKLSLGTLRCGIGILDKETRSSEASFAALKTDDGMIVQVNAKESMDIHPLLQGAFQAWLNQETFSYILEGEDIAEYYAALKKENFELPESKQFESEKQLSRQYYFVATFQSGGLFAFYENEISDEAKTVMKRFADVFNLTYTRFLDLQKAEAQAREAKIETSLERVRSKTMAMHNSQEVGETVIVMFDELRKLGIETYRCGIGIMDDAKEMEVWTAKPDDKGKVELIVGYLNMSLHPLLKGALDNWKNNKESYNYHLKGKDLNKYFNAINKHQKYPVKYEFDSLPEEIFHYDFYFREGTLFVFILKQLTPEEESTLKRFAGVFGQTYRRYLDLLKAEAQAREATIEASLERVRSKAMAMHSSEDLASTVNIFFKELKTLGIIPLRCGVSQADSQKKSAYVTATTAGHQGNSQEVLGELDLTRHTILEDVFHHWQLQKEYYTILTGKELKEYYNAMSPQVVFPDYPEEAVQHGNYFTFKEGWVYAWTEKKLSEEERKIFRRYTSVISLTYRRFMDLKEAEAQAREAQIEASLERVRSKAMAMQKSDDLGMAVATIFEELDKLDLGALRCGIGIIDKAKKSVEVWATTISDGKKTAQISGDESMDNHPLLKGAFDAWLRQEDFSYVLQGDDLIKYYEVQTESNFKLPDSQSILNDTEGLKQYYYVATFQSGGLFAFRENPFPEEAMTVIKRFADVINFTYTRFNDLKQAEAQARESQIEVALERVRSRTMAMQKSEELSETAFVLYRQFMELGETPDTITIGIMNEAEKIIEFWSTMDSNKTNLAHKFSYTETEVLNQLYRAWKEQKKSFVIEMKGKILRDYIEYRIRMTGITTKNDFKEDRRIVHAAFFSKGLITITTPDPLSKETILLLERFAGVFDLTYTRFLDLKQSEAQTKEAQIETALERVRSRTLAMQKSDELAETAAVLFKQLILLGIAPNRLYIGIIKDNSGEIELWATDEDGSKVSTQFTGNINRNGSIKKCTKAGNRRRKSLTIDMHGIELSDYFHYLSDELKVPFKLGLDQKRRVQNIAFFSQGFIGMASPELQPEEAVDLLERFAAVFNLTYTRFNDLKIAEHHAEQAQLDLIKLQTEKRRAEDALTELRSTQNQLIQSEKMASLGELTAGIAHEIQNPLNFVNNFSEVNTELIDELNEELGKGNFEEAVLIAKDIKENEEKIKHHGKRAEGIVKGMLQHSRSSSGVKEPVNINALADEYLRLAYHGLRAKDKTFNAKMETDFDKSIGEINVVPQDIGRVILNLITNAFYVVDEKKKLNSEGYEPTVSVSTKKIGDKVEVIVKDNGNGIPLKVLDKIFQPFFTTKPTGQGTGLGLSLSYDIVKAHGGDLKVQTKEGDGAEFTVELPMGENN